MPTDPQLPRHKRLVVGITGHIGAGKTSAGKYLESKCGFQYIRYSQVLSDWLANDAGGRARLQEIGWDVMAKGMQSELNRRLIAQIRPEGDVAVDGLRHPVDFESLENSFASSFRLLYIDCPLKKRWEREKGRAKYATLESFEAADSHPVEGNIDWLRSKAAVVLRNEGTLEDFEAALDKTIEGFRMKGGRT